LGTLSGTLMNLRAFNIVAKLGLSWMDVIAAALEGVEAAWDAVTLAAEPDSPGGAKITKREKIRIAEAAGAAFGQALAAKINAGAT